MTNNTRLQNMFCLNSRVAVYVPSTKNIDKTCDTTEQVDKTAALLAELFGGSTCTDALGCWMSPVAGLVKEKTTMVFAYCKEQDLQNSIESIVEYCETMRDELDQECIALELNGTMYFI